MTGLNQLVAVGQPDTYECRCWAGVYVVTAGRDPIHAVFTSIIGWCEIHRLKTALSSWIVGKAADRNADSRNRFARRIRNTPNDCPGRNQAEDYIFECLTRKDVQRYSGPSRAAFAVGLAGRAVSLSGQVVRTRKEVCSGQVALTGSCHRQ